MIRVNSIFIRRKLYANAFADKMKTVPDILGLGLNFRPLVMINTVLVMPEVSCQKKLKMDR